MKRFGYATAAVLAALLASGTVQAQATDSTAPKNQTGAAQQQASSMGQQAAMTGGAQIQPSKVYGDMLRLFQQEIVGAAEAMPEEKFSFAPSSGNFQGVRTFAQQIQHLTEANYQFFKGFSGMAAPPDKAKIEGMKSKADILQAFQDSFTYAQKGIDSITPENAFIGLTTGDHPQTRAGNAAFCIAHAMDHYGQMVEYLRMNNIVPPASKPRPGAKM